MKKTYSLRRNITFTKRIAKQQNKLRKVKHVFCVKNDIIAERKNIVTNDAKLKFDKNRINLIYDKFCATQDAFSLDLREVMCFQTSLDSIWR